MPFKPGLPGIPPLMEMLRITTFTGVVALMTIALVPPTRIDPNVPPQSSVMLFVMVTAPNPPGSIQSISPPAAVLEIAPAKVLHGAVRLHGLASSPTPETQVLVACALAGTVERPIAPTRHATARI